jgi:HSP20 family protein
MQYNVDKKPKGRKEITVKAEIPGVEADDLDVSLDERMLIIGGERKQEKEEKEENYHRMERSYGHFRRAVQLPADVDPQKIEASYKKGVLKIVSKKTKESEVKKTSDPVELNCYHRHSGIRRSDEL